MVHILENALLMLADDCRHRHHSPAWLADTLTAFAQASGEYEPPRLEPGEAEPLAHYNRELIEAHARRQVRVEVLEFARRKRRVTWDEFRAWYIGVSTEPDEPNQVPPNMRRLREVVAGLVRSGVLRRYSRGLYEYVPHARRRSLNASGPREVDASARP